MEHSIREASLKREIAKLLISDGHDEEVELWTVAELIAELQAMPMDAPVVLMSEDGGLDGLFPLYLVKDDDGKNFVAVRVDLRK